MDIDIDSLQTIAGTGKKRVKKTKTILLWGKDDLLSSSVEFFLTTEKTWKVIYIPIEEDLQILLQALEKINPNVVIIQLGDSLGNSNLPAILLQNHPGLKVISLSLNNNLLEVYSKQNILVRSGADLISVIEDGTDMQSLEIGKI